METRDDPVEFWQTAAATYPAEVAQARKAGLPPASPNGKPVIPTRPNAASLYLQITSLEEKRSAVSPAAKTLLDFLQFCPPTPTQIQQAQQAVASCPELRLVHQATAIAHCDFGDTVDRPRPEMGALRHAARLLMAESLVLAYQGQGAKAVRNQALGFRVAQHAAAGNMLIDWLLARAIEDIALAGMGRILRISQAYPGAGGTTTAAAIAHAIEQEWRPLTLAPVVALESAWQQKEIDKVRQVGFHSYLMGFIDEMFTALPGNTSTAENELRKQEAHAEQERLLKPATWNALKDKRHEGWLVDAAAAFMLHGMRSLYTVADRPYPQAKTVFATFKHDLDTPAAMPDGPKAIRILASYLQATMGVTLESRTYAVARAHTVLAAAHLLAKPGGPSSLPPDPFRNGPLHYRQEGGTGKTPGFVVYSVGPDGNFDGGRPGAPLPGRQNRLLFRYAPGAPA